MTTIETSTFRNTNCARSWKITALKWRTHSMTSKDKRPGLRGVSQNEIETAFKICVCCETCLLFGVLSVVSDCIKDMIFITEEWSTTKISLCDSESMWSTPSLTIHRRALTHVSQSAHNAPSVFTFAKSSNLTQLHTRSSLACHVMPCNTMRRPAAM